MKKILCSLFALGLLATAQDAPAPPEKAPEKPELPQYVLDLQSLTKEDGNKYRENFLRADSLFKQKRIFECLEAIEDVHQIYEGNPSSLNLKGACYVEFRSFEKARIAFAKASAANPGNFNVRFNLAEIEFVTKNYKEALKLLNELATEAGENKATSAMLPLVNFKVLLCKLKTDDEAGARAIIAKSDFLDDSPLFYYGNAALEYFAEKGPEAEIWLSRAGRIFRDANIIAPWQDTLIEFGYIESFYGGDLEVPSNTSGGDTGD
jgi:tetratricopeptide (TPR) repeat protein